MTTDNGGEIVINPDGTYTYTPPTDFVGEDTITIEVCDEFGACEEAELSIEVRDSASTTGPSNNAPPIVGDDNFEVFTDTPITSSLIGNDSDPEGDALTVTTTPIAEPTNGTVVVNPDGTFTYTPDPGFIGEDTFEYEICDAAGACDTAVVTINVQPDPDPNANDTPDANDDSVSAQKNDVVSGDLLANDTDPNGDPLTVTTTPVEEPINGTVVINPDGTFEYTPDPDFVGNDSFVYEVCDADGACEEATVYITVFDQPPVAVNDFNNTIIDVPVEGNVLFNDSDPNTDDDLTVTMVNGQPITSPIVTDNGTVTILPDGSYVYEPNPGATGVDSFTYTVTDEGGNEVEAIVTIEIRDPEAADGTAPIANDDTASGFVDSPIQGDLLANDGDPGGNPLTINTTPTVDPANGTVVINPDGTFEYIPDAGFVGTDSFEYEICNAAGACDTATVTLNVLVDSNGMENDPPFANDDAGVGQYNDPIEGNLLANDSDPNGDPLTINTTPVAEPTNGTVVINSDGTYEYTPDPDFVGNDSFTYEVCDDSGACEEATVYLTVFNNPPVGENDFNNTVIDTPVTGNVLTNDVDPDTDDTLTVSQVNGQPVGAPVATENGTIVVNPDGTYEYTPDPGFTGTDTVLFTVVDESGNEVETSLTLEVRDSTTDPAATAPIANDDTASTFVDQAIESCLLYTSPSPRDRQKSRMPSSA